jgi:hypothetical protein
VKVDKAKKMEKSLKELTFAVGVFLRKLDAVMAQPSSPERGKQLAELSNYLEMARDKVRYFTLGVDYRNDPELKDGKRIMPKKERG